MSEEAFLENPFEMPEQVTSGPPPRKRRRPALSCEQCRKRKIKCDRNYPCNHCTQSKTVVCTYSSDNAVAHAMQESSIGAISIIPSRKKNPSSIASSANYTSDNTSPRAQAFSTLTTSYSSPATDPDINDTSTRKVLLDRIRDLEEKLAESNREKPHLSDDLSCGNSVDDQPTQNFRYESKGLRGTVSKTRFFGQSHFMYSYGTFDKIACMKVDAATNTPAFNDQINGTDIPELMNKCKSLARAAKAGPHKRWLDNPNFRESIPSREMADKFVSLYFRTSESIHRILHIPSFQREYIQYWEDPQAANTVFVLKLILVMSIGACFYQGSDAQFYHDQARQWIFAAQAWTSSAFEKGRLHMSGLQIHCLLLVARLDNAVSGDLIWIAAGALFRTALQMGYHRDPKNLPPMTQWHAEMRRRLWATIVELNTQSALDCGMPPLFSVEDYDTEAPANVDDIYLDENTNTPVVSRPPDVFTQTSLQLMMLSTLRPRLEIIRHVNSVGYDPSYDEALALGSELIKHCKNNNSFINRINAASPHSPRISQLQRNLLDIFIRRFILSVHRPFAAKAQKDPRYYYSRKVCLDCAMTLVSYPSLDLDASPTANVAEPGYKDDFAWQKTMSGGFQKTCIVHSAMIIFAELLTQIEEDPGITEQGLAAREPLKQALRGIIELAAERIRLLENNVKGHLFICAVLAQVEATERGEDVEKAVVEAASKSLKFCVELLSQRVKKSMSEEEYVKITESAASPAAVSKLVSGPQVQEFGTDFGMQDWNIDMDFMMPDSWILSGWEDNQVF